MSVEFKYVSEVPAGMVQNLGFRRDCLRMARDVPGMKATLTAMCREDPAFLLSTFGWTKDPRNLDTPVLPFILWDYQVGALGELFDALEASRTGRADVRIKKSRDMGASWLILGMIAHCWLFMDDFSALGTSRTQEYVDQSGNDKAIFQRLDFMIGALPGFLRPRMSRTENRLSNNENGSSIVGEAMTGDVGRGDRRTVVLLDEFAAVKHAADGFRALASTRDTSRLRIFNSTLGDADGAFAQVLKMPMREVVMPWWVHPAKKVGLYRWVPPGRVEVLDPNGYEFPPDYKFDRSGKVSSPWRDEEMILCANKVEIAREIDMDEVAASYNFFERPMIAELVRETSRPPDLVGELLHDRDTGEPGDFIARGDGRLKLWFRPDQEGMVPQGSYGVGADVAAGTGASNTAISVGSGTTGEKMAALVDPNIQPHEAGVYAVALARWFNHAMLIWENPGPGRNFGVAVVKSGYQSSRIYWERNEKVMWGANMGRPIKKSAASLIPGWSPNNTDNRKALYYEYRKALSTRAFVNRDSDALEECLQIVNTASGIVIHGSATGSQDPTGAKDNHGDRPTADALCWKVMQMVKAQRLPPPAPVVRPGSMAWRFEEAEREEREAQEAED